MNCYRFLPLFPLLVTCPATVIAAEEISNAGEIVISANRIPVPAREIGTSVTVLSEEDILAYGNISMSTVLRQSPGISASNYGGQGQTTSLRIRGEENYRTQIRYDGLLLSDPGSPQISPNVEHILSQNVSRVEILRGPQGLSYGADAGGVINISSRRPDAGIQGALDMQGGSFGTQEASGNIGAASSTGDVFLAFTDFATDGFNSRADDTVLADDDGYDNTTLHFRGGLNLSDKLRLDLVHRDVKGDTQYDICGFPTGYDCQSSFDQQANRLALDYRGESLTHSLSYSRFDTERDNATAGVPSFSSEGELTRIEYLGSATQLPGTTLVFGADLEEARNNDIGRDNRGLFLEYLSDFSEQLFINAGVRHDDNDDFGNNTSWRLSGAYLFTLDNAATLKLRSSYGTGFRAPSPYETDYNRGPFAYPPASLVNLEQESSKGFEAGVEYTDTRMHLEATYFNQKVEDAIYFDLSGFSGYLQDPGQSASSGIELHGTMALGEHNTLTANYTYNDTKRPGGSQRLRRPKHLLNLGSSFSLWQERLQFNAFYRMSRDAIDEEGPLEDFAVLDLSAYFNATDSLTLYGRVENLLDEEYQEVLGYNAAERTFYLGIRLNIR